VLFFPFPGQSAFYQQGPGRRGGANGPSVPRLVLIRISTWRCSFSVLRLCPFPQVEISKSTRMACSSHSGVHQLVPGGAAVEGVWEVARMMGYK
jgi:hypothetical protein